MLDTVAIATVTGKTLTVDSVNGVDATARPYFEDLPYLTLAAAQTAAVSGDTIYVRPGAYTVTAPLGKNGVNWHFEAGATVSRTIAVGNGTGIWSSVANSAAYQVTGSGSFALTVQDNSGNSATGLIVSSHTGTNLYFEGLDFSIDVTGGSNAVTGCFLITNGTTTVRCRDVFATTIGTGIWWGNGQADITSRLISANDACIYSNVTSAPTGDLHVRFDDARTANTYAVYTQGTNSVAALWIRGNTLRSGQQTVGHAGAERVYVEVQKIFGGIYQAGTGLLYIRADKVSVGDAGIPLLSTQDSPTAWISINDWDAVGLETNVAVVIGGLIDIFGGIVRSDTLANGFLVNGGTCRIHGMTIDTSLNSGGNPVTISGAVPVLDDCTLIAESTRNVIESSGAESVIFRGIVEANRPVNSNVTVTYDSAPIRQMLTPAQITADQNNYAPGRAKYYRISSNAPRSITGLVAGADGEPRHFINVGSFNITLPHDSGSSTAANRWLTPDGSSVVLLPGRMVGVLYDATTARWRAYP